MAGLFLCFRDQTQSDTLTPTIKKFGIQLINFQFERENGFLIVWCGIKREGLTIYKVSNARGGQSEYCIAGGFAERSCALGKHFLIISTDIEHSDLLERIDER